MFEEPEIKRIGGKKCRFLDGRKEQKKDRNVNEVIYRPPVCQRERIAFKYTNHLNQMEVYGGGRISSREVRRSNKLEVLGVIWKW